MDVVLRNPNVEFRSELILCLLHGLVTSPNSRAAEFCLLLRYMLA